MSWAPEEAGVAGEWKELCRTGKESGTRVGCGAQEGNRKELFSRRVEVKSYLRIPFWLLSGKCRKTVCDV